MSRRFVVVVSVALVVLAATGGGLLTARSVRDVEATLVADLSHGAQELQAGKDQLKAATSSNLNALNVATTDFEASRLDFTAAEDAAQRSRTLTVLGAVPLVGSPRVRSVLGVSEMGAQLADAGESTVAVDAGLLAPGQGGVSAGQRLVAFLQSSGPGLATVRAHLVEAKRAAATVDPTVLSASQQKQFGQATSDIDAALSGLDAFAGLAPTLAQVLGAGGKRTYLFEQVDPAELRGGGGFIGSFSLLDVDRGAITLGVAKDVFLIDSPYPMPGQSTYIPAPEPVQQAIPHGWVFGDSNHSPDFATAAQAGERLFHNETGNVVDGVISLDPWAVASLLTVTGPITVPQYGTTVRADTFPEDVFQKEETSSNNSSTRKDFFPAIATLVLQKINGLSSSKWSQLLTALNLAVTQRHLQVYLNDSGGEAMMRNIGWAGPAIGQQPGANETLMEVESNFGGTKANHFLTRTFTLDLTVNGNSLDQVLTVSWQNATPAGYLGDNRDYTGYSRLYLPPQATGAHVTDLTPDRQPVDEHPTDAQLVDGWATIHTGQQLSWTATWSTPVTALSRGYTIYWHKQAGTLTDAVHVILHVGGRTLTANTDLGQDRSIVLTSKGIKLQSGSGGAATVPFLHP